MNLLYQCMGITGVILTLYGLLAFAVTKVSTVFFWTLLILGLVLCAVFVIRSLPRYWQSTIGAFIALNAPWILLLAEKDWPIYKLGTIVMACLIALTLFTWKRVSPAMIAPICALVAGLFFGSWFVRERTWFNYAVTVSAFTFNLLFVLIAKNLLKDLFQKKSLQYGSSAIVYTAIVVAVIAVANVLSNDQSHQWDFTEEKVNQLSDQSVKILKELKKPVHATVLLPDGDRMREPARILLETYQHQTKNFDFRFTDADKDKEFATQHRVQNNDLLIEYEGQTNIIREFSEEAITQAIAKVTRTSSPTVCFTKGHGEIELEAPEEEGRSFSAIRGGLENEGYHTQSIERLKDSVPTNCSMLVIGGPQLAFSKDEAETFDKFLASGGKALVMLDPQIPSQQLNPKTFDVLPTGLEDVLHKWGVEVGRNFILERHIQLFRGPQLEASVRTTNYGNHPIVEPLKGKPTVFQPVRSVRRVSGFTGTAVELISSAGGGESWAEADVDGLVRKKNATFGPGDIEGPVPFGVAVERQPQDNKDAKSPTKLVVFGNSNFASNAIIRSVEFNFDLVLNVLNWMQGEGDRISIRPKKLKSSAIELTSEQSNAIFYVAIITIPMLVLIFGINLWWWRRRRG